MDPITEELETAYGRPLSERERFLVNLASFLAGHHIMPDTLDNYDLADHERAAVLSIAATIYRVEREIERRRRPADRRARMLLRSYLSPVQRRQLRTGRAFICVGSAGGAYRLSPQWGSVERVERHQTRYFARASYCLHDYAEDSPERTRLPTGDLTLSHLLLISADEPAFLALANATDRGTELWNGEYVRRLRGARREREALAMAAA